ncbi:MAG: hypothetical protein V1791_07360 [Pseudomonadota bacterium]
MKKMFVFALAFLLCATAVFAADPAAVDASSAPAALAALLRDSLFPLVSALALGYLSLFLNRLGQKYKIEALTQKDNIVERFAFQGIALAEEKAAQLVGSKAALTGVQKLDLAIAHICSAMPKISREQADAMVHSLLAQTSGVGATGGATVTRDSLGILGGATLETIPTPAS